MKYNQVTYTHHTSLLDACIQPLGRYNVTAMEWIRIIKLWLNLSELESSWRPT